MFETAINDSSIQNLFYSLEGYELSYSYQGSFSQKLMDSMLLLSETNLEAINEPVKNRKKVYFIMVESLQNITKHQAHNGLESFFLIHKAPSGFLITSGNVIQNDQIPTLTKKLEAVNSLNPGELKDYYYSVLTSDVFSEKGGAGLGLIEMARKSENKLIYDFTKIDERCSFFYFQTNIKTSSGPESKTNTNDNFAFAKSFHEVAAQNKMQLFFRAKFELVSLKGLIKMTENITNGISLESKKIIAEAMIEMLQNIFYHGTDKVENGCDKPGLVLLCNNEKKYSIVTGNYIANSKLEKFIKHIEIINSGNEETLNILYSELIKSENKAGELNAGLGLIDLRLKTKNKIEWNILKRSETRSFLIIKSCVNFQYN